MTIFYYANAPYPGIDPDTPAYLTQAGHILDAGRFVDPARLPGYPTMIALLFLVTGRGNLDAISVAQGVLYVLATLELYAALCLVLRRAWVAALIVAPVALNTHLLSYMRPVLSEGLALLLVATLALALVVALRWPGPRALWGVTLALLGALSDAARVDVSAGPAVRLSADPGGAARTAAAAVAHGGSRARRALRNARRLRRAQSHTERLRLRHLHLECQSAGQGNAVSHGGRGAAQYDDVTRLVKAHLARGDDDPWNVIREDYPPLKSDYYALAGDYSLAIIRAHPVEFVAKSGPVAIAALTTVNPFRPIDPHGPFAPLLLAINAGIDALMRGGLRFFPLIGAGWLLWMLWWRRKPSLLAEAMGLFALLGGYGLALTVFGGYVYFARLRVPYAPLLLIVVWGSAVLAALWLGGRILAWWCGRHQNPEESVVAVNE